MHTRPTLAIGAIVSAALLLTSMPVLAARADTAEPVAATYDARKLTLGVAMWSGREMGKLDSFRSSIGGTRVPLWTFWNVWGGDTHFEFPMAAARAARDRGAAPFIWWEPRTRLEPNDTTFTRNLNIINGQHDAYIRQFARDAKAFGSTVLIRFAMQANSKDYPWGWDYSSTDGNTIRTFKRMWRHVHGIFQQEGADNVKWVWTIATQTCKGNCLRRPLGFPGKAYVDYMGFTWENWGAAPDSEHQASRPWVSMYRGFKPIVNRLKKVSRKPIVAAAIASAPDGGNKAGWIRRGYRKVYNRLPRVRIINYLNTDLSGPPHYHRDWSLHGDPLSAYALIASKPRFRGRIR